MTKLCWKRDVPLICGKYPPWKTENCGSDAAPHNFVRLQGAPGSRRGKPRPPSWFEEVLRFVAKALIFLTDAPLEGFLIGGKPLITSNVKDFSSREFIC